VPEVRLAEVEAHLACLARKGCKKALAHGVFGELKDDAVGRRKAPVEGDVHLHLVEVAREADDVTVLPLVALLFARFALVLGALVYAVD
jgi:hypothetical protein